MGGQPVARSQRPRTPVRPPGVGYLAVPMALPPSCNRAVSAHAELPRLVVDVIFTRSGAVGVEMLRRQWGDASGVLRGHDFYGRSWQRLVVYPLSFDT